jgi:hypothetical protein
MNKREAFKQAKEMYPNLKPTTASGFTLTDDGKGVIVVGHDEDIMVVLHNNTDIYRLMSMCQLAIENREEK